MAFYVHNYKRRLLEERFNNNFVVLSSLIITILLVDMDFYVNAYKLCLLLRFTLTFLY